MGNCLPRKNKISAIDNTIAKERSNSSRKTSRSIKDGERKMLQELQAQQPSVSGGGLSFIVNLEDNKITARPPKRLQKLERNSSLDLSIRQLDEKQLKADLLRQERTASIQLKARQEQERCQSAMKRREAKSEEIRAKLEAKRKDHEKNVEERKRKLTILAQKTKAAKLRKAQKIV